MDQDATKDTEIADPMAGTAEKCGTATSPHAPDSSVGLPRPVLRHSPEALTWARHQRDWTRAELAAAAGLAESTIRGLENGSKNAGPATLTKLAKALGCPQVVLEAGQINARATSAAAALDLLDHLLETSRPAHLTRHRGLVWLGFATSGRHVGTLCVREADFDELMKVLRRHFPSRRHHNGKQP